MMFLKRIFLSLSIGCIGLSAAFSQSSVSISPLNPSINDTVTILFNAALGNKGLLNYENDVYMHSGLITATSASPSDWKYPIGKWGAADKPALMKRIGENLYEKKIVLKDYFGVSTAEEIKFICFVFRDINGTKVGKAELDKDILVTINLKPQVQKKHFLKNYVSYQFGNGILLVKTDTAIIKIQAYSNSIIKVSSFPNGKEVPDTSYSVVLKTRRVNNVVLKETSNYFDYLAPDIRIRVNKYPVRISYHKIKDADSSYYFLQDQDGFFKDATTNGLRFKLKENESIYGTGSRSTDFNKRGQKFSSYNTASYGYKIGAPTLNINIPFIVSSELYGVYFENHSPAYFDIGASEKNVLEYKVEQGNLSYFIVLGDSFQEILSNYTLLTGRQPIPPLWSLGYIQSKYGYESEMQALKIVKKLQKDKFPVDGLVLDLYWFGSPKQMGNLNWDSKKFKHPEKLVKELDALGVQLIPITETFIAKTSENYDFLDKNKLLAKNKEGNSFVIENFWAGPSGLLDIYQPEAREWMWKKYKTQIDLGINGWWCDLGEPESHPDGMIHSLGNARYMHNVYGLFWASMLAEKYKEEYPEKRLFNLARSGYAGMQRYSTFPWSGDIQRSYDGLSAQVQIMLSMGMSGVAYSHSDLGGFTGGPKNQELYTRWLQFGAFCPIMRAHGEGVPPEPIFYDQYYKDIVRNYINLRYKLLPYNYTLSYNNTISGIPIALPLNFFEPKNEALKNINDEYFWGNSFLIAPVVEANATTRKVIFPEGNWINFWNDSIYKAHSTSTVFAPLDKMPIFVKAGSIIPTTRLFNSTKYYKTDSLFVYVYPKEGSWNASFSMYEDDGKTANAIRDLKFEKLLFEAFYGPTFIELKTTKSEQTYAEAPKQRCITYILKLQNKAPRSVGFSTGEELTVSNSTEFTTNSYEAFFNENDKTLHIRCPNSSKKENNVYIVF